MGLLTQTHSHWELVVRYAGYDTNAKYGERSQEFEVVGADYAAATAATNAFLTDLGAMTEASIIGHRLTQVFTTADLVPTTQINLQKVCVVTFRSGLSAIKKFPHNLMCPADAILADGSILIAGDPLTIAWYQNFINTGGIRLSDGEYIAATAPIVKSKSKVQASGVLY